MTSNTYNPPDWTQYTIIEVPLTGPFNPGRVDELVNADFSIPPTAYLGSGLEDTLISIALQNPVTQNQIDNATVLLNAIANDPTRNDLSALQIAQADLQADINTLNAKIVSITADVITINGDNTAIPPTAGLKDQINGNSATVPATVGLKDQLLTTSGWNALSNAAKLDLLRSVMMSMLVIMAQWMTVCVDIAKSVKSLLKIVKDDKKGLLG